MENTHTLIAVPRMEAAGVGRILPSYIPIDPLGETPPDIIKGYFVEKNIPEKTIYEVYEIGGELLEAVTEWYWLNRQ
jgi:hypothetical protein